MTANIGGVRYSIRRRDPALLCDGQAREWHKWIVYAKTTNGVEIYTTDDVTEVIENGIIVKAVIRDARRWLFMLNTCVGYTKQVLGINNPFIGYDPLSTV